MIKVFANKKEAGNLTYNADSKEFIFNYTQDNPISLTMPYTQKSYIHHYNLHPIFDMNMPEGYLFELLKNFLIKEYGEINDYILFSHLSKSIDGFLTYQKSDEQNASKFSLDDILQSSDENIFSNLVEEFLLSSAIAGVQPKVLAKLEDKASLNTKEYIIKSFSMQFPNLAENEYFCMKAVSYAGIKTPKFWLSKNKKLFIMEKFTYQKESDSFYGFEEFCALFGYTKEKKYRGSYEQIAKAIYKISTQKEEDLKEFYKIIVMSQLLKNGDAHLKNFGILYTADKQKRFLAPAYDIINTVVYISSDKPALTLQGKKMWLSRDLLLDFGVKYCMLSSKEAQEEFKICKNAVKKVIAEVEDYIKSNPDFSKIGQKFINSLNYSLENVDKSYKGLENGVL